MNLTIVSDASFSNKHKVGTYAFWIVSNVGRIQGSGILRNTVSDSTEAEMKCICNAMALITDNMEIMTKVKNIYVNTDSLNAIHVFTNDVNAINKWGLKRKNYNSVLKKFTELKEKKLIGKKIFFSHIKAHKHTDTKANWVNDWADKECKKRMSEKLQQIETKQLKINTP